MRSVFVISLPLCHLTFQTGFVEAESLLGSCYLFLLRSLTFKAESFFLSIWGHSSALDTLRNILSQDRYWCVPLALLKSVTFFFCSKQGWSINFAKLDKSWIYGVIWVECHLLKCFSNLGSVKSNVLSLLPKSYINGKRKTGGTHENLYREIFCTICASNTHK